MAGSLIRWPLALGASVAVHGIGVALVLAVMTPEKPDQQPVPTARMEMASHAVKRSDADPQAATSETVEEGATEAPRVGSATVPQSRAEPRDMGAEAIRAQSAGQDAAQAINPVGDREQAVDPVADIGQAISPVGNVEQAVRPAGVAAASVAVPSGNLPEAQGAQTVVAAVRPESSAPNAAPVDGGTRVESVPPDAAPLKETVQAQPAIDAQAPVADTVEVATPPVAAVSEPNVADVLAAAPVAVEPVVPAALLASASVAPRPANAPRISNSVASGDTVLASAGAAPKIETVEVSPVAGQRVDVPDETVAPITARSERAPDQRVTGQQTASLPPPADNLGERQPDTQGLVPATPQTDALVARLAWSGGDGADVSAVSLAAIQSFLQEGDVAAGAAVRDGIEGTLAQVPCSRIQAAFRPETGALELVGHIPENGLRGPVLDAIQAQMGADIPVRDNLLILPRPQCGALAGIAAVGLPQSTDQDRNPLLVGASAHATTYEFRDGQRLTFGRSQAPDYPAYIYLDYFDAGGQVIHLAPNERVPLERFEPKIPIAFGPDSVSGRILDVTIGPPYGQEIAVAFASSVPVYDGVRPLVEPAGPYLEFLKRQIAAARAEDADFKGEWVYFFVSTKP